MCHGLLLGSPAVFKVCYFMYQQNDLYIHQKLIVSFQLPVFAAVTVQHGDVGNSVSSAIIRSGRFP